MMGCLCVDKQGNPLRPSIIWADQRAQAQAAALGEQISLRDFYHIAGHRNSASYGLQKLMWVRDNEPEVCQDLQGPQRQGLHRPALDGEVLYRALRRHLQRLH